LELFIDPLCLPVCTALLKKVVSPSDCEITK